MKYKSFTLILLALIAAVLIGACSTPLAQAQTPELFSSETPRTVSVTGSGQVMLTPDIAYVSIGVRTQGESAGVAVSENNDQAQAVMDALLEAGVVAEDLTTTNFNLYPMEEYDFEGNRTGVTYAVENTVFATVRDLDTLGDLLTAAIDAGANNIYGIQFDVADKDEAMAEAREMAVEDARTQAEDLARLADVELGPVQSINVFGGFPAPLLGKGGGGLVAESLAAPVPVSPGQLSISVDVSIIYTIQ